MHTQQIPRVARGRHRKRRMSTAADRLLGGLALGAVGLMSGVVVAWSVEPVDDPAPLAAPPTTTVAPPPTTPPPASTPVSAPTSAPPPTSEVRAERKTPKKAPERPVEARTTPVPTPTTGKELPAPTEAPRGSKWGSPDAGDEFDYTGRPDPKLWTVYDGKGHAGNGRRTPDAVSVADGILTIRGDENGNTGGISARFGRAKYGRWEVRVRSRAVGDGKHTYHPVLIVWPDSNQRVRDGEYDFLENSAPGEKCAEAFMHFPGETPKKQEHFEHCGVDLASWNVVGFEWTPDGLSGFINGKRWFHTNTADIAEMPSGHLTIQLDGFNGSSGYQPAELQVDYVRYWKFQ